MTWKNTIKKADDRYSDSKESMINQILDRMDSLKSELDESVTKLSLVRLIEALRSITLVTEEKEVKDISSTPYSRKEEAEAEANEDAYFYEAGGGHGEY